MSNSATITKVSTNPLLWLKQADEQKYDSPILFIHGMWGWHWYWSKYIEHFSALGYNCYAIDLPGHNPDSHITKQKELTISDYSVDVKHAIKIITEKHSSPLVIAHSMGGIVLQKTLESINVKGAVLLSSAAPKGILVFPQFFALLIMLKYFIISFFSRTVLPGPKELVYIVFKSVTGEEREKALHSVVPEFCKAYRQSILSSTGINEDAIHTPFLVIGAGKDKIVKPKLTIKLAKKFNAETKIFPENTHWLVRENGYLEICNYINNWINTTIHNKRSY